MIHAQRRHWRTWDEREKEKMGREGKRKSRAVARSAAQQAEEAQDIEAKNYFNSSAVKKLKGTYTKALPDQGSPVNAIVYLGPSNP